VEVLLQSSGSLIVIIASQAAGMRECCYTVLVLLLRPKLTEQLEQGSVVTQCWLLAIETIASQAAGMGKWCYTLLVLLLKLLLAEWLVLESIVKQGWFQVNCRIALSFMMMY